MTKGLRGHCRRHVLFRSGARSSNAILHSIMITSLLGVVRFFNTVIKTLDNKVVTNLQRHHLSTEQVSGYVDTAMPATNRLMIHIPTISTTIASSSCGRSVLDGLIAADQRILSDPPSQVVVSELGDSSVNFTVRVWVNAPDYWDVYFAMTESVKLAFDRADISIPFPQSDVHIHQA